MNEKTKAIIIVSLIIVAMSGAFLYQGYSSHCKSIDQAIETRQKELNSIIAAFEDFSFSPYRKRIQELIEYNPDIVEAFARRDRERLYQLCIEKYQMLKKENKFFHVMHFHLPDSTTFLRMHKPSLFDDNLKGVRVMIDDVHLHKKPRSGFEIGRHGPFFRVARPVFYKGKYIGALEFGIKAHQILQIIGTKHKAPMTSYFLSSHWQKATEYKAGETIDHGRYVLLRHGNALFDTIPELFQLDQDGQQLKMDNKTYIVHSHPIFTDYKGQTIGGVLLFQDITTLLARKRAFLIQVLFFSAVLLCIALTVLYFTFGSLMDKLLHEVKEKKNVENILARDRQRLQAIFDATPAAIFIQDMDGKILELNQTMLDMYGVTKEEGVALSVVDDYSSRNNLKKDMIGHWKKVMRGEKQQFEWIARRPRDGSTFIAQVNLEKIPYGDREVVCATVQDITARKEAEVKLASEQERLAVTLRSIGDGVITTDIEGKIVFLNKVAEELSGWTNEAAQGRPSIEVFNIINEKSGQKCASPVQRVIELGRIIGLANHTALIAKDGTIRSIADSGAPIRDWDSRVIGVVLVFRDITHEKKMEEELLKIRKLESVGVLAGGIAHDFNNILSAILGNIELVGYRLDKGDEKAYSLLSDARKATKRATKLTKQLLIFSKGGDPAKEAITLPELIKESANFVLHGSQVACEYNFPDDLWMVDVDSGQIGQVVQNIILNAKHAMPEGGTILIHCVNVRDATAEALLSVDKGDYVRITIQDTGVGIPREIIDKIFDPYFTTKQEGSGLGLAICHSIINKHDGYLTVHSVPGKGSIFTLYLPAVHSSEFKLEARAAATSLVKSARIMVMDDEEMLRDVAQSLLAVLGHEAVLVNDGEQAINKYQELQDNGMPVDLVIMDLTIPGGMGGQEAARKLLKIDPHAKIIVASGYSNDSVMANYKEYGFCAAVAKPFDLAGLGKVIDSAFF